MPFTWLQEVALSGCGGDPVAFMAAAAKFANHNLWGSLVAAVYAHPGTQKRHAAAWDDFLAQLRYGAIAVNAPATLAFGCPALSW